MPDVYLFATLGALVGIIVGILPGLGHTVAMIMLYPFLSGLHAFEIIAIYVAMITVTAYHGSIAAILLGIPGEPECLPSMKEGLGMSTRGEANLALGVAAISSFLGSIIGVLLSLLIYVIGANYYFLYNFVFQLILLLGIIGVIFYNSGKQYLVTGALMISGYLLGKVGFNQLTREHFLTFDNPYLYSGLPTLPILIYLYSIPILVMIKKENLLKLGASKFNWKVKVPVFTTLRASLIGFFAGFTPILGTFVSANLAHAIERRVRGSEYNHQGDYHCLAASQAANHAGLIGCLIPLLCFAIPITASEGVLFELISPKGIVFNLSWVLKNFHWILGVFILANIIGVITAWPMARIITTIIGWLTNYFKYIGITVLIGISFWMGQKEGQLWFYMAVSAVLLPIGLLLRKQDLLPLVVTFLLAENIDNISSIVYRLHLKGLIQ